MKYTLPLFLYLKFRQFEKVLVDRLISTQKIKGSLLPFCSSLSGIAALLLSSACLLQAGLDTGWERPRQALRVRKSPYSSSAQASAHFTARRQPFRSVSRLSSDMAGSNTVPICQRSRMSSLLLKKPTESPAR